MLTLQVLEKNCLLSLVPGLVHGRFIDDTGQFYPFLTREEGEELLRKFRMSGQHDLQLLQELEQQLSGLNMAGNFMALVEMFMDEKLTRVEEAGVLIGGLKLRFRVRCPKALKCVAVCEFSIVGREREAVELTDLLSAFYFLCDAVNSEKIEPGQAIVLFRMMVEARLPLNSDVRLEMHVHTAVNAGLGMASPFI